MTPSITENPNRFDELCGVYRDKMRRIVGSDKCADKIARRNGAQILLTQRLSNISSSDIRVALQEHRVADIREALAQRVLREILEKKHYQ